MDSERLRNFVERAANEGAWTGVEYRDMEREGYLLAVARAVAEDMATAFDGQAGLSFFGEDVAEAIRVRYGLGASRAEGGEPCRD